jgi:hypothetical protein
MAKDFASMEESNPSANPEIHSVSDPSPRVFDKRRGLSRSTRGLLAKGWASLAPWLEHHQAHDEHDDNSEGTTNGPTKHRNTPIGIGSQTG